MICDIYIIILFILAHYDTHNQYDAKKPAHELVLAERLQEPDLGGDVTNPAPSADQEAERDALRRQLGQTAHPE